MPEVIEVLNAVDVGILSSVAKDIWREHFPGIISLDQIDYMLEKFLSPGVLLEQMQEGYELYMLINEEEPMGFFVIHPEEDKLFLSKIYLYKKYRGQGNSSIMFDHITNRAKELGLEKIYLTVNKENDIPIKVYKHKGFETVDSVVTDIGNGFVMDDYIMELSGF